MQATCCLQMHHIEGCVKNKYILTGLIAGSVILVDQVAKFIIIKYVFLHDTIQVIPGFFNITHVRNKGAAFSLLSDLPAALRPAFFIIVTCAALVVIVAVIRRTQVRLQLVALSLIAGGAVGNLVDRIRFGEVVDFIDWYVRSWHWPAFNVADSAISIGAVLLGGGMLLEKSGPDSTKPV